MRVDSDLLILSAFRTAPDQSNDAPRSALLQIAVRPTCGTHRDPFYVISALYWSGARRARPRCGDASAHRLWFERPGISVRVGQRQVGCFVDTAFGHAEVSESAWRAESAGKII